MAPSERSVVAQWPYPGPVLVLSWSYPCDIEPGGLCRQRQKSRGVVVECSYCAHAFHLRCLPSTVRDKVMDSQGHWACDSCAAAVEAGGESANTYEFADSGAHDKLLHDIARYIR